MANEVVKFFDEEALRKLVNLIKEADQNAISSVSTTFWIQGICSLNNKNLQLGNSFRYADMLDAGINGSNVLMQLVNIDETSQVIVLNPASVGTDESIFTGNYSLLGDLIHIEVIIYSDTTKNPSLTISSIPFLSLNGVQSSTLINAVINALSAAEGASY